RITPGAGVESADRRQREITNRSAAVRRTRERPVVDHDDVAVGGELQIALDHLCTELEGLAKGCERILRTLRGSTAVRNAHEVGRLMLCRKRPLRLGWVGDRHLELHCVADPAARVATTIRGRYDRSMPAVDGSWTRFSARVPMDVADALGARCIEL